MENLPLLDIVIGLSLIYTSLSLLASELTQYTITALKWKQKYFRRCLMILLGESSLIGDPEQFKDTITNRILLTPRIISVMQSARYRNRAMMLSDVPPLLFSETLLEVLQNLSQSSSSRIQQYTIDHSSTQLQSIQTIVEESSTLSLSLRTNLTRLIRQVETWEPDPQQQMARLKHEIARWYGHAMAEMSPIYKHHYKLVVFFVSLGLTVAMNVDSLYIIRRISENTAMRAITTQNATQIQGCKASLNSPQCTERLSGLMESTTIPVGWQDSNRRKQFARLDGVIFLRTIGGWSLTSIAIAMGSRFWLQLLRRLGTFLGRDSQPRR